MNTLLRTIGIVFLVLGLSPILLFIVGGIGLILLFAGVMFDGMHGCGVLCKAGQIALYPITLFKIFPIQQVGIVMLFFVIAGAICLLVYTNQRRKFRTTMQP